MYKRRKRAKYTWLPSQWFYDEDQTLATPTNAIVAGLPVDGTGAPNITFSTVLLDSTLEDTDVNPSQSPAGPTNITIADIVQSNEYFIKRIVGNIWVGLRQDDSSNMPACLVEAGLFVSRADSANPELPIGSSTNAFAGYDPGHPDTVREPWIWRRTWLLSNQVGTSTSPYAWGPATNWGVYDGGLRTGPVIDQKTARRVKSDERLFLAVSTRCWPPSTTPYPVDLVLEYTREFRVLGQLRRPRSTGTF